jgi:hypothetical protein
MARAAIFDRRMRGTQSFDGVLRSRSHIDTCGIGGGRVGFVTPTFASGWYASSMRTPPFVAHLMR